MLENAAKENELAILAPKAGHGSAAISRIAEGSGIVGRLGEQGLWDLYYEGNLYGAENLRTWRERVSHAAGRQFLRAPTVARLCMRDEEVQAAMDVVGWIRHDGNPRTPYLIHVDLDAGLERVCAWTHEDKEGLIQWALVSSEKVLVTGDKAISDQYEAIMQMQRQHDTSYFALLNRGFFRQRCDINEPIELYRNGGPCVDFAERSKMKP